MWSHGRRACRTCVYEQVQESALSHYSTVVEHDRTPNAFLGTDSSDTLGNCWPPKGALL